jgi:hypothetical protein
LWEAIAEIAKYIIEVGGLTGVVLLLWMADRHFLVRDLKEQNATMISAFKDNTVAVTKLATLIDQLCQRI